MSTLQQTDIRRYGLLALPLAVAGLPLYLYAPDLYVTERRLPIELIGGILVLVRIIDAIQDPLIGAVSDRIHSRMPLILVGIAGMAAGMLGLFIPPSGAGAAWFASWIIVATTAYSLISINLNALGGLWSGDRHERTRIVAVRERFTLLGITAGVLIPGLLAVFMPRLTAFAGFAIGLVVLLGLSAWQFFLWGQSHPGLLKMQDDGTGKGRPPPWMFLPKDPPFRRLIVIAVIGSIGSALPAVLFLFFVRDRLQAESLSWLFLMLYFLSALAGIPFWRDLSRSQGKVRTWCLTMLVAVLAFTAALFIGPGHLWAYGIVCITTGFALGGDLIFPASLIADYLRNGKSSQSTSAGAHFAWLSLIQKFALGLAAGIAYSLLGWSGFETGTDNAPTAVLMLVLLYAALPLILKGCAVLLTWLSKDLLEDAFNHEKETNPDLTDRPSNRGPDTNRMLQPNEN